VGAKLADEVWDDGNAVGHTIAIGGIRCKVIAQVSAKEYFGMNYGFDWLSFVAAPLETLAEVDPSVKANVTFEIKVDSIFNNGSVKRIANAVLLDRHNGQDDFQILDFSAIMARHTSTTDNMLVIVGFIAGIALLVGGVGVMNMMLVSVSERVREIGIRKALGASPTDISSQFLLEAIVLAGTGGLIGVTGGIAMAEAINLGLRHFMPSWVNVISDGSVAAGLAVSLGVGIVFGYFPARRAARMEAIVAIRQS
jgi:putative ABC transport system permease protein